MKKTLKFARDIVDGAIGAIVLIVLVVFYGVRSLADLFGSSK